MWLGGTLQSAGDDVWLLTLRHGIPDFNTLILCLSMLCVGVRLAPFDCRQYGWRCNVRRLNLLGSQTLTAALVTVISFIDSSVLM